MKLGAYFLSKDLLIFYYTAIVLFVLTDKHQNAALPNNLANFIEYIK